MPSNTTGFANLLTTKWQGVLRDVGKEKPLEYPMWLRVANMDVNPMNFYQVSGLGNMLAKPEGEQFPNDQPIIGGSIAPQASPYGMIFEVTFEMYDDDQYQIMASMWREEGRSARYRQELVAAAILNNAFSNSFPGYDGVSLCNTAHPLLAGGTGANRASTDLTFSVTGIQNAILNFESLPNQRGLPEAVLARRVLITPTNRFLIREVLGSSGQPQSADNDMNSLLPENLSWNVLHYQTYPNDWFVAAGMAESDAELLWRNRPRPSHFDDPFTMNGNYALYERLTSYFGTWQWVFGSHPS